MRVATENFNLQKINPAIAKEWHPVKNKSLTPKDVRLYSNKKVWWLCKKGHEWEARVYHRSTGRNCPYCAGKLACKDNCLQAVNPIIAKEWHPTKNRGLTPKDVTAGTKRKVWWLCKKGHEWQARISNRNKGTGCPYCSGRLACRDNCLKTINPIVAKEWHPTKNGKLTPKDVAPNSRKIVWWICSKNKSHAWKARIYTRNWGSGCPYCAGRKK